MSYFPQIFVSKINFPNHSKPQNIANFETCFLHSQKAC